MKNFALLTFVLCIACFTTSQASAERARDIISSLNVKVIYASNSPVPKNVGKITQVSEDFRERLSKDEKLRFSHYGIIADDAKPVFRSVENWSQPLESSKDIRIRFEPQARPSKEVTRLDIELWLNQKKSLKAGVALSPATPLFVVGPEWKNGRIILAFMIQPYQTPIKDTATK